MYDAKEMFDRFITMVRSFAEVPDGMSIAQYLLQNDIPMEYQDVMRVEITWDGGVSLWSLYFNEDGQVQDTKVYFGRDGLYKVPVEEALAQAPSGGTVVEILAAVLPKLELICDDNGCSEDFGVFWEWYDPHFSGHDDSVWPDSGWQTAQL